MRMKILSALTLISVVAYAAVTPPRTITADIIRTVGGLRVFWTLPNQLDDIFVGQSTTQTLTHKTMDGTANTFVNIPTSSFSGSNLVVNGGTGRATLSTNGVLIGEGTSAINQVTGAQFQPLVWNGAGDPSFQALPLNQSAAVTGTLPITNGGTNNPSLGVTAGGLISSDGSKLTNIGAGTAGQIPIADGAGNVTWSNNTITKQIFTSSGSSGPAYFFWVSSANATVGSTYTTNSQTCTTISTIAASARLAMTCTGSPVLFSGTLTKTSGTGDASITYSPCQAMQLYTLPANVKLLKAYVTGGGGGSSSVTTAAVSAAAANGGGGGGTAIKWIANPVGPCYYEVGAGGLSPGGQPTQHGFPSAFVCNGSSVYMIGEGGGHGGSCPASTTPCGNSGTGSFAVPSGGDVNLGGGVSGNAIVQSGTHACAGGGGGSYWIPGPQFGQCDFTTGGATPNSNYYGVGASGAILINGGANQTGGIGMSGVVVVEEYY